MTGWVVRVVRLWAVGRRPPVSTLIVGLGAGCMLTRDARVRAWGGSKGGVRCNRQVRGPWPASCHGPEWPPFISHGPEWPPFISQHPHMGE